LADAEMRSSTSGKVWKGPHPQRKALGQKHMRPVLVGLVVLMLIALSSGVAMGSLNIWSGVKHAMPLQEVSLTLPKSQPSVPPMAETPTPDTPPSAAIDNYPTVALSYTGTIHNTLRNMDATLSLLRMRQDGAYISGYYTVEAGLVDNGYYSTHASFIDSGYFTGKVTLDNKIRLLIPSSDSSLPLLFKGQFQSDGSISGTYCGYRHHQCEYSTGKYGSWNVTPQATDR